MTLIGDTITFTHARTHKLYCNYGTGSEVASDASYPCASAVGCLLGTVASECYRIWMQVVSVDTLKWRHSQTCLLPDVCHTHECES